MYLTYSEYVGMGGTQPKSVFERFNTRAQALISRATHRRVETEQPVRPSVRYAAFDIVSAMISDADSGADTHEVASVSNDGVSVTYAVSGKGPSVRYSRILRDYLSDEVDVNGTPLMYMGVDA